MTKLNWNNFQFKRGYTKYKLTKDDISKFYNFTFQYYGSYLIEDWIYFINKIPDPMELVEGQEIILPVLQDIEDFIKDQLGVQS